MIQAARPFLIAALSTALSLSSASSSATVLLAADFEAPAYSLGALAGQQNWADLGGSGARYDVISNTVSGFGVAGAQTLSMAGGTIAGSWIRNFNSPSATSGTVVLDADFFPTLSKSTGLFLGSVGAGAGAYFFFDADGTIHVWDGAGVIGTGTAYTARRYHVTIRLDIDADRYSVELDGAMFLSGLDARSTPGPVNPVEILEIFSNDGTEQQFSYVDNILVTHEMAALPEPGTLALFLGAGLLGAGARRRSRKSSRSKGI